MLYPELPHVHTPFNANYFATQRVQSNWSQCILNQRYKLNMCCICIPVLRLLMDACVDDNLVVVYKLCRSVASLLLRRDMFCSGCLNLLLRIVSHSLIACHMPSRDVMVSSSIGAIDMFAHSTCSSFILISRQCQHVGMGSYTITIIVASIAH